MAWCHVARLSQRTKSPRPFAALRAIAGIRVVLAETPSSDRLNGSERSSCATTATSRDTGPAGCCRGGKPLAASDFAARYCSVRNVSVTGCGPNGRLPGACSHRSTLDTQDTGARCGRSGLRDLEAQAGHRGQTGCARCRRGAGSCCGNDPNRAGRRRPGRALRRATRRCPPSARSRMPASATRR